MDMEVVGSTAVPLKLRHTKKKLLKDLLRDNPDVDPYPEGWFVIEFSKKVKENKLISKRFFGEDVVIYRHHKSKEVIVSQAHCPHLGAHFDSYKNGGCIEDGKIVCPYHHLRIDPLSKTQGRLAVRTYPTVEHHGFVLACRQRSPDSPPLPKPGLSFNEVDEEAYMYSTQSVGIFHGDMLIPLMANSDYMHFQTVHGTPEPVSTHEFSVSEDGNECYFGFEIPRRNLTKVDEHYPRAGSWRGLRQALARPKTTAKNLPETLTKVTATGVGAGLNRSRWWEPQFGIDLLSWLYVTPIDPYSYELFMCHGAKTIKKYSPPLLQKALDKISLEAHMIANHLYVGQEDPPFYNADKIRLNSPALTPRDKLINKYVTWWKTTFFSKDYQAMIEGYDIDFS